MIRDFLLLLHCGSTTQKALPPQEVLLGGKNFCKGSVFFERIKKNGADTAITRMNIKRLLGALYQTSATVGGLLRVFCFF